MDIWLRGPESIKEILSSLTRLLVGCRIHSKETMVTAGNKAVAAQNRLPDKVKFVLAT